MARHFPDQQLSREREYAGTCDWFTAIAEFEDDVLGYGPFVTCTPLSDDDQ